MGVGEETLPTELFMDVDRSGPIPLYYQVATRIEEAIRSGKVPAGSRLENKVALSKGLGCHVRRCVVPFRMSSTRACSYAAVGSGRR